MRCRMFVLLISGWLWNSSSSQIISVVGISIFFMQGKRHCLQSSLHSSCFLQFCARKRGMESKEEERSSPSSSAFSPFYPWLYVDLFSHALPSSLSQDDPSFIRSLPSLFWWKSSYLFAQQSFSIISGRSSLIPVFLVSQDKTLSTTNAHSWISVWVFVLFLVDIVFGIC